MMYKKRVVITGIGVISPIGMGKKQFWKSLFEGKSGFREISLFDTLGLKVKIAGEIIDFKPEEILGRREIMDLDRATLLLLSAAKEALEDSRLPINNKTTQRIGVSVGTTFGNLNSVSKFDRESLTEGPRYVNPSIFPSTVGNSPASRISIRFKIKGFNTTISTGMCAALDAIDYARDCIELGRADTVVVGAVEDLNIQTFLGFHKLEYLAGSKEGTEVISCPFDKSRNGIVLSEGATVLIMQDSDLVERTKTHIYGEILGIGSCFDPAKFYRYNPKAYGMRQAMRLALEDAQLSVGDIDCIFANANSTQDADSAEALAIREVFGGYAKTIPVTAIKSMLGETFSAAGGFGTVSALGALKEEAVPPVINYRHKDYTCDLYYAPYNLRRKELSKIMINAFSYNGANTSIIIGQHSWQI